MSQRCKYCKGENLEERPTTNVHKFELFCLDCNKHTDWGRLEREIANGQYQFTIELAEEVSERFLLFKLVNDDFTAKKQIWKNENGSYFYDLKRFVRFYDDLDCNNLFEILCHLEGRQAKATVENIIRKGKRVIEIKSLDKLL